MEIEITELDYNKVLVKCSHLYHDITYWAPDDCEKPGGYVRMVTPDKPGVFGDQVIEYKDACGAGHCMWWDGKKPLITKIKAWMKKPSNPMFK